MSSDSDPSLPPKSTSEPDQDESTPDQMEVDVDVPGGSGGDDVTPFEPSVTILNFVDADFSDFSASAGSGSGTFPSFETLELLPLTLPTSNGSCVTQTLAPGISPKLNDTSFLPEGGGGVGVGGNQGKELGFHPWDRIRSSFDFLFGKSCGGGGGGGDPNGDAVGDQFKLEKIGGLKEQVGYLKRSIVLPLVRPEVLREWGVGPPKGILLHGPPGTGKTFLAKALVNTLSKELGQKVNFYYRKGGDLFSKYFGASQKQLVELFSTAKSHAPSVLFFDELDGLCPSRDKLHPGAQSNIDLVTSFLGQMDALEPGKVFVIGATNRLDAVDPAILRPGRFDKHLAFGFPDAEARQKILEIHTRTWSKNDKPTQEVLKIIAERTMGFTGADLEKLCQDVVYVAMGENGGQITEEMKVTQTNWVRAVRALAPRIGIGSGKGKGGFGSAIYVPQRPSEEVIMLTKSLVTRVVEMLEPMLDLSLQVLPRHQKSFLLHLQPHQSPSFLTCQILPCILTHASLSKWTIFELSPSLVTNLTLQGHHPSIFASIQHILSQAISFSAEQPVILLAPNLNELLELTKANHVPVSVVLQSLDKLRGPNLLLLATSSLPPDDIEVANFNSLFPLPQRQMHAANPGFAEIEPFFEKMVRLKLDLGQVPDETKRAIQQVVRKAAECADNRNYEAVLRLWGKLSEVEVEVEVEGEVQQEEAGPLRGRYEEVLKKFNGFE